MDNALLLSTGVLFSILFVLLSLLCLPLYHWDIKLFLTSRLWIKVYWWIPIFSVMLVIAKFGLPPAVLAWILLSSIAMRELHHASSRSGFWLPAVLYAGVVSACLLAIPFMFVSANHTATTLLITICFVSALSDVGAFFFGNYLGRHHLPEWINPRKSYEGVLGQLIGAFVGGLLVSLLPGIDYNAALVAGIGLASAFGDIINSIVKRKLDIKDWGSILPGHGGVLDRFSSLSFALAFGYLLIMV